MVSAPELATPTSMWTIDCVLADGTVVPLVYLHTQAKEIARRIIDFYGLEAVEKINASVTLYEKGDNHERGPTQP